MPTDVDKAYVKKHKLNDLLNELYKAITDTKPDDPIEFAIKHLESKLPTDSRQHKSEDLTFKITSIGVKQTDGEENNFLNRFFNRKQLTEDLNRSNVSGNTKSDTGTASKLAQLSIFV
jgi:hypothetical protein